MPLKMTKRPMKIEPALNGAVSVVEAAVAMAMAIDIYDVLVDTMKYLAFGLMNGADETFVVFDIVGAAVIVAVVVAAVVVVADDGVVADAFVLDDVLYLVVRCLSRNCVLCSSTASKKVSFDCLKS